MIADIVIGFWVIVLTVAHLNWRIKVRADFEEALENRLKERDDAINRLANSEAELRFSKSPGSAATYDHMVRYFYSGSLRELQEKYFFFVPLTDVVKDLMNHTGMEYKYEESKPEKIEVVKKAASRKRK